MPAFPTPYTVQLHAYQASAMDAHGNVTDLWDEVGTEVAVYGWAPPSPDTETLGGREAITRGLDLYVPPEVTASPQDRFTVDGARYDVVGHPEDFTHGPFGWQPGKRISLTRIDG